MRPALDVMVAVQKVIDELRCPASTIAVLAGVGPATLSRCLNRAENPGAQNEINLREAVASLRKLVTYLGPVPLDFRRVERIRECIEMMENNRLQIVIFSSPDIPEEIVQQK